MIESQTSLSQTRPRLFVDFGYLSWQVGTSPFGMETWSRLRPRFSKFANTVLLMDSQNNFRNEIFPEYKAQRKERREQSDQRMQRYHDVRWFQGLINEDITMDSVKIDRLEADDLIAILAGIRKSVRLIGTDKDLLQLPNVTIEKMDGSILTIAHYTKKLPKGCRFLVKTPADIMFSLAMFGDNSDNVPRLLETRRFDIFEKLIDSPNRYKQALDHYKESFWRNIQLVALPAPFMMEEQLNAFDCMKLMDSGEFWHLQFKQEYHQALLPFIV